MTRPEVSVTRGDPRLVCRRGREMVVVAPRRRRDLSPGSIRGIPSVPGARVPVRGVGVALSPHILSPRATMRRWTRKELMMRWGGRSDPTRRGERKELSDASPFYAPWRQSREAFYAALRDDPELAAHLDGADGAGFVEILDHVRADPEGRVREYLEDARVVQAVAWLSGGVRVTCEADDHRVSRQRGATKTPSERAAEEAASRAAAEAEAAALRAMPPAAAKEEGNRLFKLGRLGRALEHYEWAVTQLDQLAVEDDRAPGLDGGGRKGLLATCHANVAAVRLRQERWADAEAAASLAIEIREGANEKETGDAADGNRTRAALAATVKARFRRGQARERLRAPALAAGDFRAAAAAASSLVERIVQHVRETGTSMQRRQPHASPAVRLAKAEAARCEREAARMEAVAAADAAVTERAARGMSDEASDAQTLLEQGVALPGARDGQAGDGAGVVGSVGAITLTEMDDEEGTEPPSALSGAVRPGGALPSGACEERDYTHWMRSRVTSLVDEGNDSESSHRWFTRDGGEEAGRVRLTRVLDDRFDGHAIVRTKGGRRALYYELDVTSEWTGWHRGTGKELKGTIRLYNVAQDTQFRPGGDPGTSYLYALSREAGPAIVGAWVEEVMEHAGELFEVLAGRIGEVLRELTRK